VGFSRSRLSSASEYNVIIQEVDERRRRRKNSRISWSRTYTTIQLIRKFIFKALLPPSMVEQLAGKFKYTLLGSLKSDATYESS
jgi:hypothetical protein